MSTQSEQSTTTGQDDVGEPYQAHHGQVLVCACGTPHEDDADQPCTGCGRQVTV